MGSDTDVKASLRSQNGSFIDPGFSFNLGFDNPPRIAANNVMNFLRSSLNRPQTPPIFGSGAIDKEFGNGNIAEGFRQKIVSKMHDKVEEEEIEDC